MKPKTNQILLTKNKLNNMDAHIQYHCMPLWWNKHLPMINQINVF